MLVIASNARFVLGPGRQVSFVVSFWSGRSALLAGLLFLGSGECVLPAADPAQKTVAGSDQGEV